jgi:hypothetical protein
VILNAADTAGMKMLLHSLFVAITAKTVEMKIIPILCLLAVSGTDTAEIIYCITSWPVDTKSCWHSNTENL